MNEYETMSAVQEPSPIKGDMVTCTFEEKGEPKHMQVRIVKFFREPPL
jgi:hypothetical protein